MKIDMTSVVLAKVRQQADRCSFFVADDEDEQMDDDCVRSCYNCGLRRWLPAGFECGKALGERNE
ncbi:hypothetical protein [Ferrimonas pelagia]|uniref:Uncharacterized protein n=1 Tax=Ferrimonas pelagia TaxID=1177826 RepID=A0ABP9FCP4_9GAMM